MTGNPFWNMGMLWLGVGIERGTSVWVGPGTLPWWVPIIVAGVCLICAWILTPTHTRATP